MPQGFVFPPPPPPPPVQTYAPPAPRNASFGRGRGGLQSRGRGRGTGSQSRGRGGSRGSADWDRPQHNHTGQPSRPFFYQQQSMNSSPSNKRTHKQAFDTSRQHTPSGFAAPAVPSFGYALPLPIPSTLPSKEITAAEPKKKCTFNRLGLTPRKEEHESSEDDADEESRLALNHGDMDHQG